MLYDERQTAFLERRYTQMKTELEALRSVVLSKDQQLQQARKALSETTKDLEARAKTNRAWLSTQPRPRAARKSR